MTIWKKIWITFFKLFYRTCGEATYLMAKEECAHLSPIERIKLKRHMSKCKYCNCYKKEQELLMHSIDKMKHDVEVDKYLYFLTPEQKQRLKNGIHPKDE